MLGIAPASHNAVDVESKSSEFPDNAEEITIQNVESMTTLGGDKQAIAS